MKNAFSVLVVATLLAGTLIGAFDIGLVRASGPIYIRADGSIDPSTASIATADGVTYTFTDNLNESWIIVERDNIVIDGAGYTLQGSYPSIGIDLTLRTNVVVHNVQIINCTFGILLNQSSSNVIIGNYFTLNSESVYLTSSSNNSISGNTMTENAGGVGLVSSSFNKIKGNNVTHDSVGIWLRYSSNNNITGNYVAEVGATWGITLLLSSCNNTISGNTVTNSQHGIGLQASCTHNNITRNKIIANLIYGLQVDSSSNHTNVIGNTIADNSVGIWFSDTADNRFYHNNLVNNTQQAYAALPVFSNVWDNGSVSGGNYWSNYNGTDSDYDGIGDIPYTIDADNVDNYPLMSPWPGPGDVDGNGVVNILDVVMAVASFHSIEGDPSWNPDADQSAPYGKIDIFDLVTIASNYGRAYP